MKRILDSFARENAPDQIQLYFFFHRRGSQLQYTQIGMLQTLSHQLMCQVGLARTMCDVAWAEKKRVQGGEIHARNWRLEELLDLFSMIVVAAVEKQEFKILVDALDEAGEEAAKDSLYCFHGLSNDISETQARIGICFSCRRYPYSLTKVALIFGLTRRTTRTLLRFLLPSSTGSSSKTRVTERLLMFCKQS